jgi:hypothetical protein
MSDVATVELVVQVLGEGLHAEHLDELSRQLQAEVQELAVESVRPRTSGAAPKGTKSLDAAQLGQMVVTLAPIVIPPLFELLKSWTARSAAARPVRIKVMVGDRTAEVEYDPTTTSAQELETLVIAMGRSSPEG